MESDWYNNDNNWSGDYSTMKWKDRKLFLLSKGKCPHHPQEKLTSGRKTCKICSKQQFLRRKKLISNNKCPSHPREDLLPKMKSCKICLKNKKTYYGKNKPLFSLQRKKYRIDNLGQVRLEEKRRRDKNKVSILMTDAKIRAKKKGLKFKLKKSDFIIPKKCPILGIPIFIGSNGRPCRNSPSLDRINIKKGYIKENIQIISYKANTMKNNATLKELRMFSKWIKAGMPKKIVYITNKEHIKKIHKKIIDFKYRAKDKKLNFNLTDNDVKFPKTCPILGIPIYFGSNKKKDNSPSLDRFNNKKGYTKENVWIISNKANRMKSDATFQELIHFANWVNKNIK